MVVRDPNPSSIQFSAIVLKDYGIATTYEVGIVANNWNTNQFELSNWEEFKKFL